MSFYETHAWQRLRYQALRKYGFKCMACGDAPSSGAIIEVDHIKPSSKFPELALSIDNLQVLCRRCNRGKSNQYFDDLRPRVQPGLPTRRKLKALSKERRRVRAGARLSEFIKKSIAKAEQRGDTADVNRLFAAYISNIKKMAEFVREPA